MSSTVNQPYDYNLIAAASVSANKLAHLDISALVPVFAVDPQDSVGKVRKDDTSLDNTDVPFGSTMGDYGAMAGIEEPDGSDVSYTSHEIRLPPSLVPKKKNARRQVNPKLLDKAAQAQVERLAWRLNTIVIGMFTAANFSGRTADVNSIGEAKKFNDLTINAVRKFKDMRDVLVDLRGTHLPDRCIIGEGLARYIGQNEDVLAKLPTVIGSHGLNRAGVKDLLEQHLEMEVVINRAWRNGSYLWDSNIIAFSYVGANKPQRPAAPEALPPFVFPGLVTEAERDQDGLLTNTPCTAAMIMERFPEIEDAIGDGNPALWGVTQKDGDRAVEVSVSAFGTRLLINTNSGYIWTDAV
jgi:hypothetical protein